MILKLTKSPNQFLVWQNGAIMHGGTPHRKEPDKSM